tara:strand:- start:1622 stop:2335 length:714 start_codon:yes stop_codon:yes gene_type:complete
MDKKKLNVEVCILCKNELICLKKIYKKIKIFLNNKKINFFIIDASSSDGSVQYYKKNKIEFYTQKEKGRGNAIIEAFKIKKKTDALIFFSPDGNEDIKDVPIIIRLLKKKDLVIGTRMIEGAQNEEDKQILKFRKWANNIFNLFANLFFNQKNFITDSINGYRGIKRKTFYKLKCDEKKYAIEYQMTIRAMKKKLKICEFPTIENDRIAGITQAPSIETGITFIRCLLKEILVGKNF